MRQPGIAVSAMEKPVSGWLLHGLSTTRSEEHTWVIFHEHRLKQTEDIKSYNGEYLVLIFRVKGMSMLEQVLCYANGLMPRTYVKLENLETLSDAVNIVIANEVTHFIHDARDRQVRHGAKKLNGNAFKHGKSSREIQSKERTL
ncbi:LOW QUALITY PROTEIN: Hypothetical protein PHPALM_3228 [Phytophthora palmivora]|uniref:Uncharacterized protein n=1 Tax=Phytophthora palmivora TaxID=4796 RepID=A0A2P4YMY2_9STRA|nr:LOW QUALITY PROTEIN: Hypothetical protein PHPALM_3228 [Phytophthora palmivora]